MSFANNSTLLRLIRRGPPWRALPTRPHGRIIFSALRQQTEVEDDVDDTAGMVSVDEMLVHGETGARRKRRLGEDADDPVIRPTPVGIARRPDYRARTGGATSAAVKADVEAPNMDTMIRSAIARLKQGNQTITVSTIVGNIIGEHPAVRSGSVQNYIYNSYDAAARTRLGIVDGRTLSRKGPAVPDKPPRRAKAAVPGAARSPRDDDMVQRIRQQYDGAVAAILKENGTPSIQTVALKLNLSEFIVRTYARLNPDFGAKLKS